MNTLIEDNIMKENAVILIAEDDRGHFELIKRNLHRSRLENEIINFKDGQEIIDFLFTRRDGSNRDSGASYLLLLDIRMPKINGVEVLRSIKSDDELKKLPVIMLTTTDDSEEVKRCYDIGCNFYMVKPADYEKFMEGVENLGRFLSLEGIRLPVIR